MVGLRLACPEVGTGKMEDMIKNETDPLSLVKKGAAIHAKNTPADTAAGRTSKLLLPGPFPSSVYCEQSNVRELLDEARLQTTTGIKSQSNCGASRMLLADATATNLRRASMDSLHPGHSDSLRGHFLARTNHLKPQDSTTWPMAPGHAQLSWSRPLKLGSLKLRLCYSRECQCFLFVERVCIGGRGGGVGGVRGELSKRREGGGGGSLQI